jgi:hypothetical protein
MSRPFAVVILLALALWMSACSSARVDLDFSLTNLTGASLKYVYLSPSGSSGWGENVLAGQYLKSGDTLRVKFNPNETAIMWDLRIEGDDGRYAEWKNLKLVDISQIRLAVEQSPQLRAVAELE